MDHSLTDSGSALPACLLTGDGSDPRVLSFALGATAVVEWPLALIMTAAIVPLVLTWRLMGAATTRANEMEDRTSSAAAGRLVEFARLQPVLRATGVTKTGWAPVQATLEADSASTLDGPTTIPTDLGPATVTNQVGYGTGRNNFNLKLGTEFADAIGAYLGLDAGVIAFTKTVNFGTLDSSITGTVTLRLRRGEDYTILDTRGEGFSYHPDKLSMERTTDAAFGPLDRIGQLTMRNLDIADSRSKLETYASRGQLLANYTQLIGELEPGRAGAITGGASESEGEQWLDAAAIESGTD